MADARGACRMVTTQLEQDVHERAGLEVLAMKPLVVDVEDREQTLLGLFGAAQHLRFDEIARPALFAQIEERDDQIVLGRKVPVERRLGDARARHDLVDPHRPYAAVREQLVARVENPLAGGRLPVLGRINLFALVQRDAGGLSKLGGDPSHETRLALDIQVCLSEGRPVY